MIRRFMLSFGPVSSLFDFLTFGIMLAMSQRILAEVGRPIGPAEREPA